MKDPSTIWTERQRLEWGRRIIDARRAAGYDSQHAFAYALRERGVNVSPQAVGFWERGDTAPSDWYRWHIAQLLGRPVEVLFGYVSVPGIPTQKAAA